MVQEKKHSVLFVCRHNVLRSPTAARLLCDLLAAREELQDWRVESAGIWADDGQETERNGHNSRSVNQTLLGEFNLILVMERGQRDALVFEFPEYRDRIYTLSSMAGYSWDIHNPRCYDAKDLQLFEQHLARILQLGFQRISDMSGNHISSLVEQQSVYTDRTERQ